MDFFRTLFENEPSFFATLMRIALPPRAVQCLSPTIMTPTCPTPRLAVSVPPCLRTRLCGF